MIYIVAPVNFESYALKFNLDLVISAASQKVFGIARAIQSAQGDVALVAFPKIRKDKLGFRKSIVLLQDSIHIFFAPTSQFIFFRRVLNTFYFLYLSIFLFKKQDQIILYNYYPEYLFGAIWLFLFKTRVVLDIEDAPRLQEKTFQAKINRFILPLLLRIASFKYICASQVIAKKMNLKQFFLVYGAPIDQLSQYEKKWEDISLNILYGGTFNFDTGSNIFIDAVRILDKEPLSDKKIQIFITGYDFDQKMFYELKDCRNIKVEILKNLSPQKYRELLKEIHIGLNLRNKYSEFSLTTFPSKVIEYISVGLLLVTTDLDEIFELIGDDACYIYENSPTELANILKEIASNPNSFIPKIQNSQKKLMNVMHSKTLGLRLCNYLKN